MTKPLSKLAQQQLESHKHQLEWRLNEVWSWFYGTLLEKHGECTDPACPHGVGPEIETGAGRRPVHIRHLAHVAINSQLVEDTTLAALRKYLTHDVAVNHPTRDGHL